MECAVTRDVPDARDRVERSTVARSPSRSRHPSKVRGVQVNAAPNQPAKVAVIWGGDSQRSQSAAESLRVVCAALGELGHEAVQVRTGSGAADELIASQTRFAINLALDGRLDDGSIQALCTGGGILCAGAPAITQRLTADKAICSTILANAQIPVPRQVALSRSATYQLGIRTQLATVVDHLGEQAVVKPRHGHAGLGVSRPRSAEAVVRVVESAFKYADSVVIEASVPGREISVLLTGPGPEMWAAGLTEVAYDHDKPFCAASGRMFQKVGQLDHRRWQPAVETARAAARALRCKGLACVDLIVDEHGKAWVFDVDCILDWSPAGRLAACLASEESNEKQLIASLLNDTIVEARRAA